LQNGKYSLITSTAGKIWKNLGNDQESCEILFAQMRKYKLKLNPYHEEFKDSENETPKLWWLATDDMKPYLQQLALYVLSATPHSANCERVFSTLGWIYGKRRLRLQLSKVEAMAKIRSFYVSKVNEELLYASSKYSKNELKNMINESLDNLEEDVENIEENDEIERIERNIVEQSEIPNQIVSVLILENIFDMNEIPFIKDPEDSDDESDDEISENDDNGNTKKNNSNYDYDVNQLAAKYLD
jgi:hypothetical protein